MTSLLRLDDIDVSAARKLIDRATEFREVLDRGDVTDAFLQGKTVANVFFENSTRTQLSFDLAAQRLGAYVLNFNEAGSSTSKGETLRDTVETIGAIGADVIVVRHSQPGSVEKIARWTRKDVVNAGEGAVSHPTQALLDAVTLTRRFGSIEGLTLAIVGDVAHSRVAASLGRLLPRLGATLVQIGPEDFLDPRLDARPESDLGSVIGDVDVVYLLRVQTERGASVPRSYVEEFQMSQPRFSQMRPDAVLMHPGPVNRDVEVESALLDEPRSLVLEQVANGVPTRMAVLEWVVGT